MVAVAPLSPDTDTVIYQDGRDARTEQIALVTGAGSGIGLALVEQLLQDDHCSAVYAGCRAPDNAPELLRLADEDARLTVLVLDVTQAQSLEAAVEVMSASGRLDLVINTAGVLHQSNGMQPEKKLSDINFDDLLLAYDVNALGAMRLAVALEPLLKLSRTPRFASLSARVGSISDNQLGGWYGYRASKAALNMLLRTLAIEWARVMPNMTCVALHPGTVKTDLSAPFTRNSQHTVFTPAVAAGQLLSVVDGLGPEQNGRFYAWDGQEIPW